MWKQMTNGNRKFKRQLVGKYFLSKHWTWWLSWGTLIGFVGLVLAVILFIIAVFIFSRDLPSPDTVVRRDGFATKILDRDEKVLYEVFSEKKRLPVEFDQIPEHLKLATIAVEDKDFYRHEGFDLRGMLRGMTKIFTEGRAQGGSTLTQQLVKNVLLTSERTLTRKIKEFVLAVQLERKFSKDEILQMYLNEAPYGGTAWGVQAASETYFGKDVSEVNLTESVILAGLPQRPSYYSPFSGSKDAYIGRAEHVASRMLIDSYITPEEFEEVKTNLQNVEFASVDTGLGAPHFVTYVKQLLAERYGESAVEGAGLVVTTTLDTELQNVAQEAVSEEIKEVESIHITNGAAVVLNAKTGEILAMVGSKNYNASDYDGKFNVTTALRQPGSAIKPVTYVTALKKGYTASTLLMDVETVFPGGANNPEYKPVNYDGKYRGPVQIRYALANSMNVPAVKMLAIVGIKDVLSTAFDMGLITLEPTQENMSRLGLSLTLGGGEVRLLELTGAYSAFANGGLRVDPIAILKVVDRHGNVLEEHKPESDNEGFFTKQRRVLTEEQTWIINNILSDNVARSEIFGVNSALKIYDRQIAVKTGTTNDQRDNWTVGWNSSYITGVWVGNNDNSPMTKVASGVTGAAPIWRRIMIHILDSSDPETFDRPDGIVERNVDKISGYSAHHDFPSRVEYFIAGTEPDGDDPVHVKLRVCKSSGKLATPNQIANSQFDEKEYLIFKEIDPVSKDPNVNKWQEGILVWMANNPDEKYHPPSEYCDNDASPVAVNFVEPRNHDQVDSNSFKIKVDPQSLKPIRRIEIKIDGGVASSISSPPWEDQVNLSDGPHKIEVSAWDEDNKQGSATVEIGVKVPWNWQPTPSPTGVFDLTPTSTLTF